MEKSRDKLIVIMAQLEAVKAGMADAEFEPYARAIDILIKTMENDSK